MGSGTTRLDDEHLADYLNEHLLASEGGLRAFKAAADTWAGTPHERTLHALVGEIERDRRDLAQLIQRLGYRPTGWKRALTLAFATVGRANPVNLLRRTGGSMAQLELDVLTGAVRAKRSMWDTLLEIADHEPRLDQRLLHDLAARADQQIGELQNISRATCRDRFLETA